MAQLETTWEGYVERVETAAAVLDRASTTLKAQLLQACTAFTAACRQCRADLRDRAPYDGKVHTPPNSSPQAWPQVQHACCASCETYGG